MSPELLCPRKLRFAVIKQQKLDVFLYIEDLHSDLVPSQAVLRGRNEMDCAG